MSRVLQGFLSGGVYGAVVSVLGLGVASLVAPQPPGNTPPAAPQLAVSDVMGAGPEAGAEPPAAADGAAAAPGVMATLAEPADPQGDIAPDTAPATLPQTVAAVSEPVAPEATAAPRIALADESPVLPNPQALAPEVPLREADVVLSTAPATPPARPLIVVEETAPATEPTTESAPQSAPESAMAAEPAVLDAAPMAPGAPAMTAATAMPAPEAPVAGAVGVTAVAPETADPTPTIDTETAAAPAPVATPDATVVTTPDKAPVTTAETPVTEAASPVPDAQSVADTGPDADAAPAPTPQVAEVAALSEPAPAAAVAPAVPAAEQARPADAPAVAAPAAPAIEVLVESQVQSPAEAETPAEAAPAVITLGGEGAQLPQGTGTVRVNRPGAVQTDVEPAAAPEVVLIPDAPALTAFAASFANPQGLPLLTVVLIDGGAMADAAATVAALGLPVTIAVDPAAPGAADRAATYRAAGLEIAAIARLPLGATATDAEVSLEAVFATLPQAVAALDPGEGGALATAEAQFLSRLARDGRGLVALASGISAVEREAAAAGVPARLAADDLDGEGQAAATIRRFLDGAALKAGQQEGGVVLVARVRPETLAALAEWAQGRRAATVALAPLSALLAE